MFLRRTAIAMVCVAVSLLAASAHAQLYTIDSTQIGGWDGYIHLYQNSFDPNNQLANLLAGDDDGPGGIGTSQILDIALSPGNYILVTSGFAAGDAGPYEITISGGPPGAVPSFLAGDTTNGPLWDRPVGSGPNISGLGPVNYDAVPFIIPEPSAFALLAVGGMLFLRRRR